jgi:hypothetical protein
MRWNKTQDLIRKSDYDNLMEANICYEHKLYWVAPVIAKWMDSDWTFGSQFLSGAGMFCFL